MYEDKKKNKRTELYPPLDPYFKPIRDRSISLCPTNNDSSSPPHDTKTNILTIFLLFSPCTVSSGPDSEVLSTVLWPSSQSTTSPPSLFRTLMRAALQHSPQWMRSLLSPLFLLFPLFPPQQDRKTEEIQQERQTGRQTEGGRERENERMGGGRQRGM